MNSDAFRSTQRWRRYSRRYLARHPWCMAEGCDQPAEHTDHIVPTASGGSVWSPANHQALCKPCHSRKTVADGCFGYAGRPRVVVVAGPPGAGKTTYVQQHMQLGDVVVDMDLLWQALTLGGWYEKPSGVQPIVWAAYRGAVDAVRTTTSGLSAAWIVTASASSATVNAMTNELDAELLLLETTLDECKRRIRSDSRRTDPDFHIRLADRWFNSWHTGSKT